MEDELIRIRREKLESLGKDDAGLYPNDVKVTATTDELHDRFDDRPPEELASLDETFDLAGRIMALRNFGKASFLNLQDRKGRIQVYVKKDGIGEPAFESFRKMDIGDIIFASGPVFKTRTGELTVEARQIRLLAKALRPLPEKWHGLTDVEIRYRQRHRSNRQPPGPGRLPETEPDRPADPGFHAQPGFPGSRDAHDAPRGGRGHGETL